MADEGAAPRELVIEACRRNNTDLLEEVIKNTKPLSASASQDEAVAELLNDARDGMGNAALHVAASAGSYETLDLLLDQPGLETDPLDRISGETPLHKAVLLCNTFPSTSATADGSSGARYPGSTSDGTDVAAFLEANEGHPIVEILVDAGCDPRIRNKAKMKAVELVEPRNEALRDFLRRAEFALMEGGDDVVAADDFDEEHGAGGVDSASDDSD